ncbi:MAG: hypothetical protein ACTSUQ_12605 [Candidatus Freyarchaeota archaeon]|nr:hypothetical protein [Candidatus Sigynarchaeota archaeon]
MKREAHRLIAVGSSPSTVSKKGLTTIPRKIGHMLKIKTGDKLECQIGKREGYTPNPGVTRPLHFPQRKDPNTTYEKVEHPADSVIEREAGRGKYQ